VLTPYTSLLVLETDADFARFRLDRKALANVLTVDGGRLAVARRSAPPSPGVAGNADARLATAASRAPVTRAPRPMNGPLGGVAPNAPAAPWGRDDSLGSDPLSARGSMWGASVGESFGAGGLGLSGIGEGGGGWAEGIGLGRAGTLGHG